MVPIASLFTSSIATIGTIDATGLEMAKTSAGPDAVGLAGNPNDLAMRNPTKIAEGGDKAKQAIKKARAVGRLTSTGIGGLLRMGALTGKGAQEGFMAVQNVLGRAESRSAWMVWFFSLSLDCSPAHGCSGFQLERRRPHPHPHPLLSETGRC